LAAPLHTKNSNQGKKEKWQLISYCSYYKILLAILSNKDYICSKKGGYKYSDKTNLSRMERAPKSTYRRMS
jgi:hypothetical protein